MGRKRLFSFIFFIGFLLSFSNFLYARTKRFILIKNLQGCVETALKYSPMLNEKAYDIKAKEKAISIAKSDFFPHIDLKGSYVRSEYPNRVIFAHENNQPGIFNKDLFQGSVELTLPIFLGGKRVYNYKAARLLKDISVNIHFFTKQELIYNIVSTYLKIIETKKAILAVDKNIELLNKQLEDIDLKLKVGKVAPVDRLKVLVPIASLKARKKTLEQDTIVLKQILKRLIGVGDDAKIHIDENEKIDFKLKYNLTDIDRLFSLAKQNRPEYKVAKEKVDVAKLNLKKQKATRLPAITLSSSYNLRSGSPYSQDGPPGAIDHEDYYQASLNINIPLFYGGAIVNNISKSQMELFAARQSLRDLELQLKRDITQAISEIISAKYSLEAAYNNKRLAIEVLRIEKLKYKNGKNTINDVLDAHANLLTSELDYVTYSFKYDISKLNLYKAIGYDLNKALENK
ncbi:multidrug efflux RND transporter outer membrane channel subunit OprM [Desulfothermus okinawensis JCM 13304]